MARIAKFYISKKDLAKLQKTMGFDEIAGQLGISRQQLYNIRKEHGLVKERKKS